MTRALLCVVGAMGAACATPGVEARFDGKAIQVTIGHEPFATVHFDATPRPYVWPLYAAGGVPVTRNHPMAERDGEQHDHAHHQSFWFAHGDVDGFDFWHGKGHRERVEVENWRVRSGDSATCSVGCDYRWLVDDEHVVAKETRLLTFGAGAGCRTIDVVVQVRAVDGPLRLGDTKEGTFAMRVHPALRVEGTIATGTLRDSEGRENGDVWGKRARWIDDSGVVDGQPVGVAIFDHPSNLRHPTWWHARTYGLLAANPFGVHDFEKQPKGTGDHVLEQGESLRLSYRVVLHGAGWNHERIEAAYAEWITRRTDSPDQ